MAVYLGFLVLLYKLLWLKCYYTQHQIWLFDCVESLLYVRDINTQHYKLESGDLFLSLSLSRNINTTLSATNSFSTTSTIKIHFTTATLLLLELLLVLILLILLLAVLALLRTAISGVILNNRMDMFLCYKQH